MQAALAIVALMCTLTAFNFVQCALVKSNLAENYDNIKSQFNELKVEAEENIQNRLDRLQEDAKNVISLELKIIGQGLLKITNKLSCKELVQKLKSCEGTSKNSLNRVLTFGMINKNSEDYCSQTRKAKKEVCDLEKALKDTVSNVLGA